MDSEKSVSVNDDTVLQLAVQQPSVEDTTLAFTHYHSNLIVPGLE
jgi:hypothetical protein